MDEADVLPTVVGLEELLSILSVADRDQLLQELLVAAAHGGEAMLRVIAAWLLDAAGQEFLGGLD